MARRHRRHLPPPGEDVLVAPLSTELKRHVTAGEDVALNVHQHAMSLWRPVAVALLVTLVLGMLLGDDRLPTPVLLAFLGSWGYVAWREVERRHNSFAATSKRVMLVQGLIAKSTPMMRLGKVTDMRLDQPLIGRLLGYGTITIESAGQDQAMHELRYSPYPTQTFRRLNETIFGDEYEDEREEPRSPAGRLASWVGRGVSRGAGAARTRAGQAADRRRGQPGERSYYVGDEPAGAAGTPRTGGAAASSPVQHFPSGRSGRGASRASATGGADRSAPAARAPGRVRPGATSEPVRPRADDDTDEIPVVERGRPRRRAEPPIGPRRPFTE